MKPTLNPLGKPLAYSEEIHPNGQKRFIVFQEFLRQMQNPSAEFDLVFIDGFSFEETLKKPLDVYLENSKLFNSRPSIVFMSGKINLDDSTIWQPSCTSTTAIP